MRTLGLLIILTFISRSLLAQEQMVLRVNENGILKILQMALQYNTASKESRTVVIPENIYEFTVPSSKLLSNPIIPIINEISDLNLNKDLKFYMYTSDIKIDGDLNVNSLKTEIFNSNENGFDLRLSVELPLINIQGANLSLCENKLIDSERCDDGLMATFRNFKIKTLNRPVFLRSVLRIRTEGQIARISVLSTNSNLEGAGAPDLDISFDSLTIPRLAIVVNGEEAELDTSKVKNEILKRTKFLAQKLINFSADFVSNDLAEMMNLYLVNKDIVTSYLIFRKDNNIKFNEFTKKLYQPLQNNNALDMSQNQNFLSGLSKIIRSAQLGISLDKVSTPGNKDIELSGVVSFMLNDRLIKLKNTFGNSGKKIPKPVLTQHRENDINLSVSEPLINGALDVANSTKIFQDIFTSISPVKGFSIRSVRLHFSGNSSIVAVVNAKLDLNKIESQGPKSWFKNKFASWLERNNNDSVIYFPIEIAVIPVFKKLSNGGTGLDLRVISPFTNIQLSNTFNYPSNVQRMSETVKVVVMEELKASIEPYTNKTYSVDLSKFLNQGGVVFKPNSIFIENGAYLNLNLSILDINLSANKPGTF